MLVRLLYPIVTMLCSLMLVAFSATTASAQVVNGGFQEWDFGDDGSTCSTGNGEDDNIVWGTSAAPGSSCAESEDDNIVWGTAADEGDDNIVWGTEDDDNIVWGTSLDGGDDIVWGTGRDDDNIVWGTRVQRR